MKAAEFSIIIPTLNEASNIRPLIKALEQVLKGIAWEVIFVDDDSEDGTAEEILALAKTNPQIRCVRRVGRRGLSSAVIEGMASTPAPIFAVMDADLQHDESLLPIMFRKLQDEDCDVVVGSRYIAGGSVSTRWGGCRRWISRIASNAAQRLLGIKILDPMSGFFALRRQVFLESKDHLSGKGFKILLDILTSAPKIPRVQEIPLSFRVRQAGESKLDSRVALQYGSMLLEKTLGRLVPLRYAFFVVVGSLGAIVHLTILGGFHLVLGYKFWFAQAFAALGAMAFNFALNNSLTFREFRLQSGQAVRGLLVFILVCSIGVFVSVTLAQYFFTKGFSWWLAGLLGAGVASVWNYALSTNFVWAVRD